MTNAKTEIAVTSSKGLRMPSVLALAVVLLALVLPAQAKEEPFSFVVLGDRTSDAKPEVFSQILDEVKVLHPALLTGIGDLVQGYTRDTAVLNAQWDTVLGLLWTGIPWHFAPGNHDITYPTGESIYVKRVGPLHHALRYGNSVFLFVNCGPKADADPLGADELRWLGTQLAAGSKARHRFVFMHKPYWRYARDAGVPDTLDRLFARYGVTAVFTGHDHFYCYDRLGSVRYFQVGPSGSRTKYYDDREAGGFQNYLVVSVAGDSVGVEVREPGKSQPLPFDVVTYQSFRAYERAQDSTVNLERIDEGESAAHLTVTNVAPATIKGRMMWQDSATSWRIVPPVVDYSLAPGGMMAQVFRCSLAFADSLYPLPELSVPYEYLPGRTTEINRRLRVRRTAVMMRAARPPLVDGVLNDACWQPGPGLVDFGDRAGGRPKVEPVEVWLAASDTMLYIAARVHESDTGRIRAAVRERDGKVYEDDNLNFVLDPHPDDSIYYQVFVNSAGTVADRVCIMRDGDSKKDYAWNGGWKVATARGKDYWTVEMSCPLADLQSPAASPAAWGANVTRFQSRLKDVSVWQVPFEHDPATFGRIIKQ